MSVFFSNVWLWITENIPYITSIITSADFVTTATAVFALFKMIKSTNKNTICITDVNKTMKSFNVIDEDVAEVKTETLNTKIAVDAVDNSVKTVQQLLDEFSNSVNVKLNAMLEVQSIVYSTIKDDNIRTCVNSVLMSAKHADAKSKAELQSELDELKEKLQVTVENVASAVSDTLDKVAVKTVGTVYTNTEEDDNFTRY